MTSLFSVTGRPSPAELAAVRRALRDLGVSVPEGSRGPGGITWTMPLADALQAVLAGFPASVVREAAEGVALYRREVVQGVLVERLALPGDTGPLWVAAFHDDLEAQEFAALAGDVVGPDGLVTRDLHAVVNHVAAWNMLRAAYPFVMPRPPGERWRRAAWGDVWVGAATVRFNRADAYRAVVGVCGAVRGELCFPTAKLTWSVTDPAAVAGATYFEPVENGENLWTCMTSWQKSTSLAWMRFRSSGRPQSTVIKISLATIIS